MVRPLEHFEPGDGLAGVFSRRNAADAEGEFLIEMASQGAGIPFDDAFGDGEVGFVKEMPFLLQDAFEGLSLGKDDEAGGVAVKAVDNPDPIADIGAAHVVGEGCIGGAAVAGIGGDGEPARPFVQHDDSLVFIHDAEAGGQGFDVGTRCALHLDGDLVSGRELVIVPGHGMVVHPNAAVFEPLLEACTLHVRPVLEEERQEFCGGFDGTLLRHEVSCHGKKMLAKEKRDGTLMPSSKNARPMSLLRHSLIVPCLAVSSVFAADFKKDIQPILERNCYECHSLKTGKKKAGFVFDDLKTFKMDIADNDVAQIRPGKPAESHFLEILVSDGKNHMPPNENLSGSEIKKITEWITEGASFEKDAPKLAPTAVKKSLPPIMSWTNLDGKTIKAGFVRLEGENVVLRMPLNSAEVPYPLAKLSEASQKLARDCAAP